MSDRLVEINRKDLPILQKIYSADNPETYIPFATIDNYIRYIEQDPSEMSFHFFCLNGDFSDGTFFLADGGYAYADTLNDTGDRLSRLIQLIDFSNGYEIECVRPTLISVIRNALKKSNVNIEKEFPASLYYLPKEEALKFDTQPPEGVDLKPLTKLCHLEKVNSVWPHRDTYTLVNFQRMAKFNINIGAFKSGDELVAWQFQVTTGLIGALQTDEKHYGKGYGALVTRYTAKKVAEKGHDVYCVITHDNIASRSLFTKFGFKCIGELHWFISKV